MIYCMNVRVMVHMHRSFSEKEGHCIENDESVVGVHVIDLSGNYVTTAWK